MDKTLTWTAEQSPGNADTSFTWYEEILTAFIKRATMLRCSSVCSTAVLDGSSKKPLKVCVQCAGKVNSLLLSSFYPLYLQLLRQLLEFEH